jgi:hypothetical protein
MPAALIAGSLIFSPQVSLAGDKDTNKAVTATTAVSAGVAAASGKVVPAANKAIWVGWGVTFGAFEVGYMLGCLLVDPPDIPNAGIPVDINNYLGKNLPSILTIEPNVPALLASAIDSSFGILDLVVANARAAKDALDRYQGALLIGRDDFANARLSEFRMFREVLSGKLRQSDKALQDVTNIVSQFGLDPDPLDLEITLDDVLEIRDIFASGRFPDVDQFALDAWMVTPEEQNAMIPAISSLTDADIQEMFDRYGGRGQGEAPIGSLSAGQLGILASRECGDCQVVPGPLPFMGLATSIFYSRKIRRRFKYSSSGSTHPGVREGV